MPSERSYTCPVCGFKSLDEPPYDAFGCATFNICPSCGTEFGYDDSTTKHEDLRRRWVAKGMPWWSKCQEPPEGWDGQRQLQDANMVD